MYTDNGKCRPDKGIQSPSSDDGDLDKTLRDCQRRRKDQLRTESLFFRWNRNTTFPKGRNGKGLTNCRKQNSPFGMRVQGPIQDTVIILLVFYEHPLPLLRQKNRKLTIKNNRTQFKNINENNKDVSWILNYYTYHGVYETVSAPKFVHESKSISCTRRIILIMV